MFDYASISEEEYLDPDFHLFNRVEINNEKGFLQPCQHFCEFCQIYDQKKPKVCSSFKCVLLNKLSNNEIELEPSLEIVTTIKKKRDELLNQFEMLFNEKNVTFIKGLKKLESFNFDELTADKQRLRIEFQLLNIQISKHLKSKEDWKMFYEDDEI